MKGLELGLDEAAALLGYSKDTVARMVDQGILPASQSRDALRISLDSITHYLGIHADQQAVQSAQRVFQDQGAWVRVFGSHAEVFAPAGFERFPHSLAGDSLRRAIAISEIRSA